MGFQHLHMGAIARNLVPLTSEGRRRGFRFPDVLCNSAGFNVMASIVQLRAGDYEHNI